MKKISTIRNYPLKDLCDKAIYKSDLYRESVATLIGLRQSLQDKIEKVRSIEDLEKINFSEKRIKKVKEKLNAKS
ncbi:hypothetical protein [Campylobacter jejuni]|uniref:hypothetical protein n=1 Tax=Campylobacter jejuni TaxID=197 RepID=UPI000740E41B|nr:hypothetical protein [Campylobacter jejuni]